MRGKTEDEEAKRGRGNGREKRGRRTGEIDDGEGVGIRRRSMLSLNTWRKNVAAGPC